LKRRLEARLDYECPYGESMKYQIPNVLMDSIARGTWKTPSPDVLRRLLGDDLPDLELFESVEVIRQMSNRLDAAGYVDDPEFCMARESDLATDAPRLVFDRALFIGGSTTPGDDVFVVADIGSAGGDPPVLVFDWEQTVPDRWVNRGTLSELIQGLSSDYSAHGTKEATD
jgi:hypothetical protein